ncbi:adenylate/guanylate cyclase domain-containing protein [Kamptonema sp. UHCC 0994]|uniref:adenylate/guanylate cyclase domain-containing protein n=1 Tax=Kamptonema sp. UHCC 0994 TaxID=3031329 RepID=UPI0023BADFE7|nr:adenylate/guanylate cyclase domain-containing protein [Kamptonema sp. UHCC 0994]MDF0556477.1 adenylate/guanylate cyclase domain-containing protein [Kamptonema sp. UHCC 0994]
MSIAKPPLRKFRLRTSVVLPFVLQIIAAVGFVGYLSFRNSQQSINELTFQLSNKVTGQIDRHLESYLEKPHLLQGVLASAFRNGNLDPNDFQALERQFWSDIKLTDSVDYIYIGKDNGDFIGVQRYLDGKLVVKFRDRTTDSNRVVYEIKQPGDRFEQLQSKPYDPRDRPWYTVTMAAKVPSWTPIFNSENLGVLQISPTTPVYDSQGQLVGVLSTNLLLAQLNQFLNGLSISKSGEAFIIERSGDLVASSTAEIPAVKVPGKEEPGRLKALDSKEPIIRFTAQKLQEQSNTFIQIQKPQQFQFVLNGKTQLVQISPLQQVKGLDWLIVVVIPEEDFMAQIYENTRNTILFVIVALGIAIAIGIQTANWITRPLLRMSQASTEIAQGNLDQQIETSPIIEIDILSQSFNDMSRQLKDSFAALHQSQEELRLANEELENRVERRTAQLRKEKERSEQLLLNILPSEIAERLKRTNESPAEHFEEATILFADIVGFTSLSSRMEPMELVGGLNQIFSAFDQLTEKYNLEKIKTIGDAYMVVGGLPLPRSDHATAIANMALDMQAYMQSLDSIFGESLEIRIGINSGPVIAGVIGIKKFIYDLWGDAVNVASRMESHGKPGYIQVTEATYAHLKEDYILESRGAIAVKGRGEMTTYWLVGRRSIGG